MSPELDHDAIRKAYPIVSTVDDSVGAMDKDGYLITIEQSKIDEARIELDKLNYRYDREDAYPTLEEQLDMQYWDQINGTSTWKDAISKVKTDNPKPS